jgi:voltage-gated potassium channel
MLRRRITSIVSAIAGSLAFGTIGFILIEHADPFSAFYMTLITITTVGYNEIFPLSHAGRIFNSFLIFFGVTTMLLAIGGMTQTVVELELNQFFSKRRTRKMIDALEDHYIVCGYGRVGRGSAQELLRAGASFLVMEKDEELVELAMRAGMLAVLGDANRDENLIDAGIRKAKGLIATLSSDADNLFLILSAKALNPKLQVSARVTEEQAERKMRLAGADYVFAPYDMTGFRMAQALMKPHVFQFIDFTSKSMGLDVSMEQVRVGGYMQSQTLGALQLRRELGVIVLAIRKADGRMVFNPAADAILENGDYLVVMGEPADLQKLESLVTQAAT